MIRTKAILGIAACAASLCAAGCGGHSSSASMTPPPIAGSGSNVQAASVNAGPTGTFSNGLFTSVTVCVPGTSTCQTINGVLVDTGSTGLRLLSSVLTISLPQQKAADGNPVVECLPFVSGFTWGPVQTADVQISGEKASAVPVQVINDALFPIPSSCSSGGTPPSLGSLNALGANGLLGVGNFAQDCGNGCVMTGASNQGLYFECPKSGCTVIAEALTQQVQNPVALFPTDNNGVIIELPAVTAPEASVNGSLVFGIGTQSNNGLNGATVFTMDANGNFMTTFNNQSFNQSFLDSGSNAIFFLNTTITKIPDCPSPETFFYCPSSTQNLSAINRGANGASATIKFSVANADSLFNGTDFVLENLAGLNTLSGFDWGVPFFYGRNVFTAIEGKSTPGGMGPYWAF